VFRAATRQGAAARPLLVRIPPRRVLCPGGRVSCGRRVTSCSARRAGEGKPSRPMKSPQPFRAAGTRLSTRGLALDVSDGGFSRRRLRQGTPPPVSPEPRYGRWPRETSKRRRSAHSPAAAPGRWYLATGGADGTEEPGAGEHDDGPQVPVGRNPRPGRTRYSEARPPGKPHAWPTFPLRQGMGPG